MVSWCHHFYHQHFKAFFSSLRTYISSIWVVCWWWFHVVLNIIIQCGWTAVRCVYCQVWWGCNVCRRWLAVITAAAMRHSNPISLISPKWSSQLEVFPNYLTTISGTRRLIPLFFPESRRVIMTASKQTQVFMDFCDSFDDLFPSTIPYPWYCCIEAVVKMPEKTQKTD